MTLSRAGEHLYVGINSTGETIRIDYQFSSQTANWGIEQFQFANGETWNLATINANAWYRGTSSNDSIQASSGNDTILGNQGNDYLRGNGGSDTYIYSSGHGNDEIDDQSESTTDKDVLKFADLNSNDVTLSRAGYHLYVGINSTGETIKIDYQFYSQTANWGIEQFQFANGQTYTSLSHYDVRHGCCHNGSAKSLDRRRKRDGGDMPPLCPNSFRAHPGESIH